MTFVTWYEEVEKKSYPNLSPMEKNALECKFFDYLRRVREVELGDMSSASEPSRLVSRRPSALG